MRLKFWTGVSLCLLLFFLPAAAFSFSVQPHHNPTYVKVIVPFPVDLVWQWTLRALNKYKLSNTDYAGKVVTTEWIKEPYNLSLFSVHNYFPRHEDVKTRLILRLSQTDDKTATIINIFKDFTHFNSVLTGWTKLEPDGIEEYVIGYRIRQLAYYHYIIAGKKKDEAATP